MTQISEISQKRYINRIGIRNTYSIEYKQCLNT